MNKAVQERVRRNSKRSARQMAKDMNVSATSMRAFFKNDLRLLSFKMRKRSHTCTIAQKKNLIDQKFFLEI